MGRHSLGWLGSGQQDVRGHPPGAVRVDGPCGVGSAGQRTRWTARCRAGAWLLIFLYLNSYELWGREEEHKTHRAREREREREREMREGGRMIEIECESVCVYVCVTKKDSA